RFDGAGDVLLALREQRRLQPLPGCTIERAPWPVHWPCRIRPDAGCDCAARALDRLAVQPDPLPRSEPPPGDHSGGNRSVVRPVAAERQPVPEAAGAGGAAAARIWRGHYHRSGAAARLWRVTNLCKFSLTTLIFQLLFA